MEIFSALRKIKMNIHYNSPVILSFSLMAFAVMILSVITAGMSTSLLFTAWPSGFLNPLSYLRIFTHVLGHASWEHLFGNLTLILLIGPLLEEKYGSITMLIMILITALITGVISVFFLNTGLLGASGIVFMLILLSSFANIKSGHIPLTFIIIVILFLGKEFLASLKPDTISQFAHIMGGICGGMFGFLHADEKKK
jgi:membrane associated rhomboid family serine protease